MECGGLPPLLEVKLASRPFSEASFGKKSAGKPAHSKTGSSNPRIF
jgi:hypothetical protein